MKKIRKQWLIVFIIFLILLIFLRVDYRFKTTVECCSDDYDYFLHASTIALDFDLDYSNQNPRPYSYTLNDKLTPIGFIGSGILSSPFLFLGNQISNLLNEDIPNTVLNYKLLIYSLSSVFYLFLSYILIFKTMRILNVVITKYLLLLYIGSSGITYFAFERFSMTHVYEVFTISLIIYLLVSYYDSGEKKQMESIFIPIALLLSFLTKMSNYYIFFLPLIVRKIVIRKGVNLKKKLITDRYFIFSSLFSIGLYSFISNRLYGEFIINPQKVYGTNITISNFSQTEDGFIELLISLFQTFGNVLFSFEFGLFWVCPILFAALFSIFMDIDNLKRIETYLILVCFGQNFFIVYLWQSAGSSYGYRYLFSLLPLSLLVFLTFSKNNKALNIYMSVFSVLSILSVVFFETTKLTQLSTTPEINSFGKLVRYVEPQYVKGLFLSFFELNSYLIIFTTSFLGAIFFKLLLYFLNIEKINLMLNSFGLPVENEDFQNYLLNIEKIDSDKFLFIALMLFFLAYYIVFKFRQKSFNNVEDSKS